MFYVYTSRASKGARALAKALGGKRLKKNFDTTVVNGLMKGIPGVALDDSDICINWGDSQCAIPDVLNKAATVRTAANKLLAFRAFRDAGVAIPRFAETPDAVSWEGLSVVRHKLSGHSGEGIELVNPDSELPEAPLYVEYIKKEQEYRVHVGRLGDASTIIAVQRKARRLDVPADEVNWQVRNHDNGFVFVREGFTAPQGVLDEAAKALVAVGLDFGAVDVVWNANQEKAYVLEINTAPGLEGQTIVDYRDYFKGP